MLEVILLLTKGRVMSKPSLFVVFFISTVFTSQFSHAATLSIDNMTITGGTFGLNQVGGAFVLPFQTIGANTNLVGGYIGSGGVGLNATVADSTGIVGMQFSGFALNIYTAAKNLGDDNTVAGSQIGGPVPNGILDTVNGTIAMDLSSWFANWNNTDIHVGTGKSDGITSEFATGTWNSVTGEYSLSWQSLDSGPYLNTSFWTLHGIASPVPLPPAIWLFFSGLLCLRFFSKQTNNKGEGG